MLRSTTPGSKKCRDNMHKSARAPLPNSGLFVSLTRHLLAPDGRWLAMKGVRPDDELKALPADITVEAIIPLTVPGLDAERHLIILKAGS
jgi:16S rRNA G527 N7-methylase RsmG